jgi:predicted permease
MQTLWQDIRYGSRMLRTAPGFALVAILALALGIGANTAVFSIINGVLLKPLEYKDPDRVVSLWEKWGNADKASVAYPNFKDWSEQNRSFDGMAAYRHAGFNLTGSDHPDRVHGAQISAGFLSVLGVSPALGRDFGPDDDQPGATLTTIIADHLWSTHFGRDPSVIGRTINLNDETYQVIGVLPPDFHFFQDLDMVVPIAAKKSGILDHRNWHPGIQVIARLGSGATLQGGRSDMAAVAGSLSEKYPDTNKGHAVTMESLYDATVGRVRSLLLLLLAAVAFVLLIACANVANLMLTRAAARYKEISIRSALGASRSRIVRLLIVESLSIALLGGSIGLLLALGGTRIAVKALPAVLPRTGDIKTDWRVLLFTLAASIFTGVLFGLAPAVQASSPDLNDSLKEGGRSGSGSKQRIRSALIVAEIAMALVLLVGAGLVIRSFAILGRVNPGFDPRNVVALDLSLGPRAYSEPSRINNLYRQLFENLKSVPGVQAAAATTLLPLDGSDSELFFYINDRPIPPASELPLAMNYFTTPDYFSAMRIPLIKGRFFDEHDNENNKRVMVIDESLERQFFPGEDPIGKSITIHPSSDISVETEIIGVAGHVSQQNLGSASFVEPQFYVSIYQLPQDFASTFANILVRTGGDPASFVPAVRRELANIDPDQPIYNARTMEQVVGQSIADRRFVLILLGAFSLLALLLASIGIYGVMSYSVAQRTQEIGVRMALGAARTQVFRMMITGAARLALAGIVLGVVGALALTRLMTAFLFGVSPSDPLTFLLISAFLAAIALLSSCIPVRRAMKVDPIAALRCQ